MSTNSKSVLLIDADSTIPNLALMKLSTFHKTKGHDVRLKQLHIPYFPGRKKCITHVQDDYDIGYCSVIFKGANDYIKSSNKLKRGGSGFSLASNLPKYIEKLEPDYSLYPNNDISYGFISRGCVRKCKFCIVYEKEGGIKQVANVDDIVRHKKVKFMDNNFLALPNHEELLKELIVKNIRCQFFQGLDIRLVNKSNSDLLRQVNYMGEYIFAFDSWKMLPIIEKKLKILFWRKPWQFKFYVYCHPDMELSEIVGRVDFLKKHQCLPYLMRDIACFDAKYSVFYSHVREWCNHPPYFSKLTFQNFIEVKLRKTKFKSPIKLSSGLYSRALKEVRLD